MYFKKSYGLESTVEGERIKRKSCRGLAMRGQKVLMIHTNRGDYMFPGGGIQEGESQEEALRREVLEETGYEVEEVVEGMGEIFVRKMDWFEPEKVFEQETYYYLMKVSQQGLTQTLEAYEADLEMTPVWIDPEEAIAKNKAYRATLPANDYWVLSELYILEEVIRAYKES